MLFLLLVRASFDGNAAQFGADVSPSPLALLGEADSSSAPVNVGQVVGRRPENDITFKVNPQFFLSMKQFRFLF